MLTRVRARAPMIFLRRTPALQFLRLIRRSNEALLESSGKKETGIGFEKAAGEVARHSLPYCATSKVLLGRRKLITYLTPLLVSLAILTCSPPANSSFISSATTKLLRQRRLFASSSIVYRIFSLIPLRWERRRVGGLGRGFG